MSTTKSRRGVVAVIVRDDRFLIIERSQHVTAPGRYCFPGGGIEADESEERALVRELQEELTIDVQPTRKLWQSTTPWGVDLSWYEATFDAEQVLQPDPTEVADVFWMTIAEMERAEKLLESNRYFLQALQVGAFTIDIHRPTENP